MIKYKKLKKKDKNNKFLIKFYIFKIIKIKLISKLYNNLLYRYFRIKKTKKLIILKYCLLSIYYNIKIYIKKYNIYLLFKIVKYKSYSNL